MSKAVCVSFLHSRQFENGPQAAVNMGLDGFRFTFPVPEIITAVQITVRRGNRVQSFFQFIRDWQKYRLAAFLRPQKYPPPVAVLRNPVTRQHRHVADTKRGIAQHENDCPHTQAFVLPDTHDVAGRDNSADFKWRKRHDLVWFDVARHLDLARFVLFYPTAVKTESQTHAQDSQLL